MSDFVDSLVHLLLWITTVQILFFASYSRIEPITENVGLMMVVILSGVSQILWNAFLAVSYWNGGERIFDWSMSPWIPSVGVYLSTTSLLIIVGLAISVFLSGSKYSLRQKIVFLVNSVVVTLGTLFIVSIPMRLQQFINTLDHTP
ncbi:hypothetical protein ACFPK9_00520 [Rubritalea spongiae]|uniref:Uncharacterized protein n=1 Tax=Rubritalea spongiae TaxID=430797 RepID=A0ABW5DYH1_9BACT